MSSLPRSRYIDFLPGIYRRPDTITGKADPALAPGEGEDNRAFLERFLLIFETMLGRADAALDETVSSDSPPDRKGLAELLDVMAGLFYPQLEPLFPGETRFIPPIMIPGSGDADATLDLDPLGRLQAYVGTAEHDAGEAWPDDVLAWLEAFLDWQSGWIGYNLDHHWDVDRRRSALAGALDGFRKAGTSEGLKAEIEARTGLDIVVTNTAPARALTTGETTGLEDSFVPGESPVVGGVRPFAFLVVVYVSTTDMGSSEAMAARQAVQPVLDRAKPAASEPILRAEPYPFKLGVWSNLGRSTLLPASSETGRSGS